VRPCFIHRSTERISRWYDVRGVDRSVNGGVADIGPRIQNPRFEEIAMKSFYLAALIGLFAFQAAYAADGPSAPKARTQSAGKSTDANAAGSAATKPIAMSQQDRMRMCSKQATGKKGAERKTFMKSCLTTRKS
jgi:hypothetical protein